MTFDCIISNDCRVAGPHCLRHSATHGNRAGVLDLDWPNGETGAFDMLNPRIAASAAWRFIDHEFRQACRDRVSVQRRSLRSCNLTRTGGKCERYRNHEVAAGQRWHLNRHSCRFNGMCVFLATSLISRPSVQNSPGESFTASHRPECHRLRSARSNRRPCEKRRALLRCCRSGAGRGGVRGW